MHEDGTKLESVNRIIKRYFPEFDKDKLSKSKAEDLGLTQEEILDLWQKKSKISIDLGNYIHDYAEKYLTKQQLPTPNTKRQKYLSDNLVGILEILNQEYKFLFSEKIIFSKKLRVAGTVDAIFTKKDKVFLFDWKTSKKINFYSFNNSKAFFPIDNILNSNYYKYSLQLNFYEYILREENYFPPNVKYIKFIVHISEKPNLYQVKNLQEEVKKIVQHSQVNNK